jgi:hypothetical protein
MLRFVLASSCVLANSSSGLDVFFVCNGNYLFWINPTSRYKLETLVLYFGVPDFMPSSGNLQ